MLRISILTIGMAFLPLMAQSQTTIDVGTVAANGSGYTYDADGKLITINSAGNYILTGSTTENRVVVQSGLQGVNVTLNGVSIDVSKIDEAAAFDMTGATVTVSLASGTVNTLKSGYLCAGLAVNSGTLTLGGSGTLNATGGNQGAGIGGNNQTAAHSITINGGIINAYGGGLGAGIGGEGEGCNVTINGGTITAEGNYGSAGIGGSVIQGYGAINITINGGTVTARSVTPGAMGDTYYNGAAIGSAGNAKGACNIFITGGVVNASVSGPAVSHSAAIGTGNKGTSTPPGAIISISGGVVTATGASSGHGVSVGIGGDPDSPNKSDLKVSGNAIVMTSAPTGVSPIYATVSQSGGLLIGADPSIVTDFTLNQDFTIQAGEALKIPAGKTLTIAAGKTLTNNGTIINNGTLTTKGTFVNNGGLIENGVATMGDLVITSTDKDVTTVGLLTFADGCVTITQNGNYRISMRSGVTTTTTTRLVIDKNVSNSVITLSNVSIDMTSKIWIAAFDMAGATVKLMLEGANSLKSGIGRAGLVTGSLPGNGKLTIDGTGSLSAYSEQFAPGIGGDYYGLLQNHYDCGEITIQGGTVVSESGWRGAGIGCGQGGGSGTINITGGTVTARGGHQAAAIGGGYCTVQESNGFTASININISGGTVTAEAGDYASAIGQAAADAGCTAAVSCNVSITGGKVLAKTRWSAKTAIGGGENSAGATVAISGGYVIADASESDVAQAIGGVSGATGSLAVSGNSAFVVAKAKGANTAIGAATTHTGGILINGATGVMKGTAFTVSENVEIPSGTSLTIDAGQTLTVASGKTLTNKGAIVNKGRIVLSGATLTNDGGTLTNNGTIVYAADNVAFGDFKVTSNKTITDASVLDCANGVLTIKQSGTYEIAMRTGVTQTAHRIEVKTPANVTLNNVNINAASAPALDLSYTSQSSAFVSLKLKGTSSLKTSANCGAISLKHSTSNAGSLSIDGGGTLIVDGGGTADDIEGNNIKINGGSIKAEKIETPENSRDENLYLVTATLKDGENAVANAVVTTATILRYKLDGAVADSEGKLYLWLASREQDDNLTVTVGEDVYRGKLTKVATDNSHTLTLKKVLDYDATLSPETKDFGTLECGDVHAAQTFTIANIGMKTLENLQISLTEGSEYFEVNPQSIASIAKDATATFTVAPKRSLAASESPYTGKLKVSNDKISIADKALQVKIVKKPQTINWSQNLDYTSGHISGNTLQLTATVGSGAVSYTSDNTDVATINGSTLTIHKAGTAKITASNTGADECHLTATAVEKTFTIGDGVINVGTGSGTGFGWKFSDNVFTITQSGKYTLSGTTSRNQVHLTDGCDNDIILSDVNIDVSDNDEGRALWVAGATARVTLVGSNVLKGGRHWGGITTTSGALTIKGNGSLAAYGGRSGAAIGGSNGWYTGPITIESGFITAYGNNGSAIGNGATPYQVSPGKPITIKGGTVVANGRISTGDKIIITGGSVKASSISPTPINESNTALYRVALDISGHANTRITASSFNGYGLTDVKTDADGKVYLYLPATANCGMVSLTVNGKTYQNRLDAVKTDNTSAVTLFDAINDLPTIITAEKLPRGKVGTAYSKTIQVANGGSSPQWELVSGSLPSGYSFSNGTIAGTTNEEGVYTITLRVATAEGYGSCATKTFTLSTKKPTVTGITPANQATAIDVFDGLTVVATFDGTMNTIGTATATATIDGTISPSRIAWSENSSVLTLTFPNLDEETEHTIAISGFMDIHSVEMENFSSTFTAGKAYKAAVEPVEYDLGQYLCNAVPTQFQKTLKISNTGLRELNGLQLSLSEGSEHFELDASNFNTTADNMIMNAGATIVVTDVIIKPKNVIEGNYTAKIALSDDANKIKIEIPVKIKVEKLEQTITWTQDLDYTARHLSGNTLQLTASISPGSGIQYSSNNEQVASVNGTTLTVHQSGTAVITATSTNSDPCIKTAEPVAITFTVGDGIINMGDGTGTGWGWTFANNVVTIANSGSYTIGGSTTANRVAVAGGVTANVVLDGLSITNGWAAFDMRSATVDMTISGTNYLQSGGNEAGLMLDQNAKLTLGGTGSLEARSGERAAGIGSRVSSANGKITINSGTITAMATTSSGGAGIGGGAGNGAAGTIIINGGFVTASSVHYNDAAIGSGGLRNDNDRIEINGGTIIAQGTSRIIGASNGSNVVVNGGNVNGNLSNSAVKNGSGTSIYRVALTIPGLANTAITASSFDGYSLTDVKTDNNGTVYLYLPANAACQMVSLTAGNGTTYQNRLTEVKTDNSSAATLFDASTPFPTMTSDATLPEGKTSQAYSYQLSADVENPIWTLISGSLPAGYTFNNGLISGTTAIEGDFGLSLRVADANGYGSCNVYNLAGTVTDGTPPLVAAIVPADGATDAPCIINDGALELTVVVTFNEKMDTDFDGTASLDNGASLIASSWSDDKKTLTIRFGGVNYITAYSFNLSGCKDVAGNVMEAFTSRFKTEDQLKITPSTKIFDEAPYGYANSDMAQTFSLSNTGIAALSGLSALITEGVNYFEISEALNATQLAAGDVATVGIRPKNGLKPGVYTGKLTIAFNGGTRLRAQLSFTVVKAPQSIAWNDDLDISYDADGEIKLTATATSGGEVTFRSTNSNVASTNGSNLILTGAGTAEVIASQSGNEFYEAATEVKKTLTVPENIIDLATGTGTGFGWTFAEGIISLNRVGAYTLTGTSNANRVVANCAQATIKLSDATIDLSGVAAGNHPALDLSMTTNVVLERDGSSALKGSGTAAGIVSLCGNLSYTGNGALDARVDDGCPTTTPPTTPLEGKELGDYIVSSTDMDVNDPAVVENNGTLRIKQSGNYTISMRTSGATSGQPILVSSGITADITLCSVRTSVNGAAFDMRGATVDMTISGANYLQSGGDDAGLMLNETAKLTLGGTGSLEARSGNGAGAGIGSRPLTRNGTIIINSGTIRAMGISGNGGAGIGGGAGNSHGGTIIINGGFVTAHATYSGEASIGTGGESDGTDRVEINGGTVIAQGSSIIGARNGRNTVVINGGTVKGNIPQTTAKNSADAPVYRNTLTVGNPAYTNVRIGAGSIGGVACAEVADAMAGVYGIRDVMTDGDGNVYFYLPVSADEEEITIKFDDVELVGSYTRAAADNSATLSVSAPYFGMPDANGIVYVKQGGTGHGSSWSDACGDLGAVMNVARTIGHISQIWVYEGSYSPTFPADGVSTDPLAKAFVLPANVAVYGGFTSEYTNVDGTVPAFGSAERSGISTLDGGGVRNVVIASGNLGAARLDGFTLTGGTGQGGALALLGAQWNQMVSLSMLSNLNIIANNAPSALLASNCTATLVNGLIADNGGNGVETTNGSRLSFVNSTIAGNDGAAMRLRGGALTAQNTIVWGNDSGIDNIGAYLYPNNTIIQGTDAHWRIMNLGDLDPQFIDADAGNYGLTACSPAIDMGNTTFLSNTGLADSRADRGATLGARAYTGNDYLKFRMAEPQAAGKGAQVKLLEFANGTAPYSLRYTVNGGTEQTATGIADAAWLWTTPLRTGYYSIALTAITDAACTNFKPVTVHPTEVWVKPTVSFVVSDEDGKAIADPVIMLDEEPLKGLAGLIDVGEHFFTVSKEGYETYSGDFTMSDFDLSIPVKLVAIPTGTTITANVAVSVKSRTGKVIADAIVSIDGDALAAGEYNLTLPRGSHQITVAKTGYGEVSQSILLLDDMTLDVTLQGMEDFETGDFSAFPWGYYADLGQWTFSNEPSEVYQGEYSAKCSGANYGYLYMNLNLIQDGELTFYYKSAGSANIRLGIYNFLFPDVIEQQLEQQNEWTRVSVNLSARWYQFTWVIEGEGEFWLDNIVFPPFEGGAAAIVRYDVDFAITDPVGQPVAGASVTLNEKPLNGTTAKVAAGSYAYSVAAVGYETVSGNVEVIDKNVTQNIVMYALPDANETHRLSVSVTNAEGNPIEDVAIALNGDEQGRTTADGSLSLEAAGGLYTLTASKDDYETKHLALTLDGDKSVRIILEKMETFENGSFPTDYDWQMGGNAPWTIVSSPVYEGSYSAQSGKIDDNQSSTLSITVDVAADGEISFARKISSEECCDRLRFYINGQERGSWGGELDWNIERYSVTAGRNTFTWTYSKDYIYGLYVDCAWLDNIVFPSGAIVDDEQTSGVLSELVFDVQAEDGEPLDGAAVSINGKAIAGYAVSLAAGDYSYSVAKEGYRTATGEFTVGARNLTIPVTLKALAGAAQLNTITLTVFDGDNNAEIADATVNGGLAGAYTLSDVPTGYFALKIEKAGYIASEQTLLVEADMQVSVGLSRHEAGKIVAKHLINPEMLTMTPTYEYDKRPHGANVATVVKGMGEVWGVSYTGTGGTDYPASTQKPVNAGTYRVTANVNESADFAAANGIEIGVMTITPKPLTVTVEAKSITYGEADPALSYKADFDPATFGDAFTGALSLTAPQRSTSDLLKAGTHTIGQGTLAISDGNNGGNYALTFVDNAVTVSKLTLTHDITPQDKTYDGNANATSVGGLTNVVTGDDVTLNASYSFADGKNVQTDGKVVADSWSISGADADNYTLPPFPEEAKATIGAKAVTVVWGETNFVYNGRPQAPTATMEGVTADGTMTLVVTGAQANAGTGYTASTSASNYALANPTTTFNIAKAVPEHTIPTGLVGAPYYELASVALPDGWTWDAPETPLGNNEGDFSFPATFTPRDIDNYLTINELLGVEVSALAAVEILRFADYVDIKWNNLFILNVKKLKVEGRTITACRWYENDVEIGTGLFFSKGNNATDIFTVGAVYRFEIDTDAGTLRSTAYVYQLDETPAARLKAYPNPTRGELRVQSGACRSGDIIEVFTVTGRRVAVFTATGPETAIDLRDQPAGIYLIRVNGETTKIVVSK